LIYFKYGTIDTFLKECRNLTENIEVDLLILYLFSFGFILLVFKSSVYLSEKLTMDGKLIKLPHLESIVVLNIPYWGGGVDPWNIGQNKADLPKPRLDVHPLVLLHCPAFFLSDLLLNFFY
jgi:hypothetical protein